MGVRRRQFANPEEAFAFRTVRRGECLIWTGATNKGYGLIKIDYKNIYAHRYAWERENGPIPDGMVLDHRDHCDPACVEVKHLRLATRAQNGQNRAGANSDNQSTRLRNVYPNGSGFVVRVRKGDRIINFGTFRTLEAANQAAREARSQLFGEYSGRN